MLKRGREFKGHKIERERERKKKRKRERERDMF